MAQSSSDITLNMLEQLHPGRIDREKSPVDNTYDLIGYENPVKDYNPFGTTSLGAELIDQEDPLYQRMRQLANWSINEDLAREQSDGDFLPAFAKAFYASENFADNIGTMLMTTGSRAALNIPFIGDWLATQLASDIQFGIRLEDPRGGNWGTYFDHLSPEEIFGENWRDLSSKEMRDILFKRKAEDIEKYWGGIDDHKWGTALGGFSGQILDPTLLVPSGYIGLVGKFGKMGLGTRSAKLAAGASTGMAWGIADAGLASYVRESKIDPSYVMANAVLGGVFGAGMTLAGDLAASWFAKHRQSGNQTTPAQLAEIQSDAVKVEQKKLETMEKTPLPDDPVEAAKAEQLVETQRKRVDDLSKPDPQEAANALNGSTKNGRATDNQRVIDDALRFFSGDQTESMDYHKMTDKMNRGDADDIAKVIDSPEYNRLDDDEKAIVQNYVDLRKGNKPGTSAKKSKKKVEEILEERRQQIVDETEARMTVLGKHTREYKNTIARNIVHSSLAGTAAGGTSYVLTGDEDFALNMALTVGGISLGSMLGGRLYTSMTSDLKQRLNHPDEAVRIQANVELGDMRFKRMLLGTNEMANNGWTTVPARQWFGRGGVGKNLARDMELATENTKLGISHKLRAFGQIMADPDLKIKRATDGPIVARIMTRQIRKVGQDGAEPRHFEAAARVRKLYNQEILDAKKLGIISEDEARDMLQKAKDLGYLNRVYDIDRLSTRKGAQQFVDRLNAAEITKDEALQIIKSITGETSKEAAETLTTVGAMGQGGQFLLDAHGVRNLMLGRRGVAMTSKFLERNRVLPERLENALDPFLVRDLEVAYIKYVESTTSRMEHAKVFGINNEKAAAYRKQINKEMQIKGLGERAEADILGAQFDPANKYIKEYFDRNTFLKQANHLAQHSQNSKLIASAPLNFTQHLIYAPTRMLRMGVGTPSIIKNMTKAYGESLSDIRTEAGRRGVAGQKFVNDVGVMVDSLTYSATGDIMGSQPNAKLAGLWGIVKRPDVWLRYSGFHGTELWNKRVAGAMGQFQVDDDLARKFALQSKNRLSKAETEELAIINSRMVDMGLDPDIPILEHAVRDLDTAADLVSNNLLRNPNLESSRKAAGLKFSHDTNFQSDYFHKPVQWHGWIGQWFGKFRNFMLHAHAFVRDDVLRPLAKGDARPLASMLVLGGVTGATVNEIKDLIRNDDYEYSNTAYVLNSWLAVGALTGWSEMASQMLSHPKHMTSAVVGPIWSDIFNTGTTLAIGVSEAWEEGEAALIAQTAADIVADLPALKYVQGALSHAGITEAPETKGDRQSKERSSRYELGNLGNLGEL